MMADDNSGKGSPGLFTGGLGGIGGMNRNSLGGAAQLSPYLNFDPSYLQTAEPDYLYDTEAQRSSVLTSTLTPPTFRPPSQTTCMTPKQSAVA